MIASRQHRLVADRLPGDVPTHLHEQRVAVDVIQPAPGADERVAGLRLRGLDVHSLYRRGRVVDDDHGGHGLSGQLTIEGGHGARDGIAADEAALEGRAGLVHDDIVDGPADERRVIVAVGIGEAGPCALERVAGDWLLRRDVRLGDAGRLVVGRSGVCVFVRGGVVEPTSGGVVDALGRGIPATVSRGVLDCGGGVLRIDGPVVYTDAGGVAAVLSSRVDDVPVRARGEVEQPGCDARASDVDTAGQQHGDRAAQQRPFARNVMQNLGSLHVAYNLVTHNNGTLMAGV